jgi:hypothetical protein
MNENRTLGSEEKAFRLLAEDRRASFCEAAPQASRACLGVEKLYDRRLPRFRLAPRRVFERRNSG